MDIKSTLQFTEADLENFQGEGGLFLKSLMQNKCLHSHTQTVANTHKLIHSQTHTHFYTHKCTHNKPLTKTQAHTYTLTNTHTYTYTFSNTHTHIHTAHTLLSKNRHTKHTKY